MRFLNVPVPKNALIIDAFLTFRCFGSSDQDSVRSWIEGELNATPAQFSDEADYFGRDRTTAKKDWSDIPHWEAPKEYKSPSFPAVIQEIVNLPDWAQGNNLVLFWHDHDDRSDHDYNTRRMAISHFHDPGKAPVLSIFFLLDPSSESYTTGGDSLQDIGGGYYAGQTFTPQTTHTLRHIDINLRTVHPTRAPTIWIYLAGEDHKPTGDYLSKTYRCYADNWNIYNVFRMRADMQPIEVVADTEYVIVVHAFALDLSWQMQWQYDDADATYERGQRILSLDYGATWVLPPGDDHIFAEFGTPPVPPPPPPPPTNKWCILDIVQTLTATGYKIWVVTNVPCHLFMHWTNQEPLKHDRTRVLRGLTIPAASQYCFVVWEQNEQHEAGDTIFHTFVKEPWPHCETRWFVFRGTIGGEWSSSTSCIFDKHRVAPAFGPPETHYFYPDPDPEVTSVDGQLNSAPSPRPSVWDILHDGTLVYPSDASPDGAIMVYCDKYLDAFYAIVREIQLYDTSIIPVGSLINDAKLRVTGEYKVVPVDWPTAGVAVVTSNPASNTALIPADWHTFGANLLTNIILGTDFNDAGHNTFTFTEEGRAAIIAAGITKLGLRETAFDIPDIEPSWVQYRRILLRWKSRDTDWEDYWPRLEVTYQPPL
ncbi:hypothetical protein ES708_18863 [subsurface metagenome]